MGKKEEKGKRGRYRYVFLVLSISPVICVMLLMTILIAVQRHNVENEYNLTEQETKSMYVLFDTSQLLNAYTKPEFRQLQSVAMTNQEYFSDNRFLEQQNEKLKTKHSFLVVRENNRTRYCGNEEYYKKMVGRLPDTSENYNSGDATVLRSDNYYLLYKKIYFRKLDGTQCNVFLVTNLDVTLPHVKQMAYGVAGGTIAIVVVFAVAILGYAFYYIVKPIRILQVAVNAIASGEDPVVLEHGRQNGEIVNLYDDFERMRKRIWESSVEQQKTDALTREVIGNISHDLKTPLTAIKGYAEGILDGVASSPERMERYVQTIHTKASDMAMLVDELAFFTSINRNSVPYNYTVVGANHYYGDCISELSLDLEMKHINLVFRTNVEDRVRVAVDLEKMKRVVNNIVGNAGKYIHNQSGMIVVSLEQVEDEIVIRFQDNGQGIDAEELPYIFDRFYRTDSSRNSKTGGSGLGLAITKKIIEDHEGRIWAESQVGKGTAIIFALKIVKDKTGGKQNE